MQRLATLPSSTFIAAAWWCRCAYNAVGERLASAETVKVGVLGQEVEISGTAKELQVVGQELLATAKGDERAQQKADRIMKAIPELNNPIADIVGVALLNAPQDGLTTDALLENVLVSLTPRSQRESFKEQAQFVLLAMAREVEKVIAQLVELDFAMVANERYSLTPAGRTFFQNVAARQRHLLSLFGAHLK